jgi:hypothetical protein
MFTFRNLIAVAAISTAEKGGSIQLGAVGFRGDGGMGMLSDVRELEKDRFQIGQHGENYPEVQKPMHLAIK